MKVNLSKLRASKPVWVQSLQDEFISDYDIKAGSAVKEYFATPGGAKAFTNWVSSKGFKASYWSIEPLTTYDTGKKVVTHIGFGIEFDITCPMLTEIRLRQ